MKRVFFICCLITALFAAVATTVAQNTPVDTTTVTEAIQAPVTPDATTGMFYIGTFSIFLSLCSFLITQICKASEKVSKTAWLKQVISLLVSIGLAFITWILHIATFMEGYTWWQVLLIGIVGGMGGSGFYTYVKKRN